MSINLKKDSKGKQYYIWIDKNYKIKGDKHFFNTKISKKKAYNKCLKEKYDFYLDKAKSSNNLTISFS